MSDLKSTIRGLEDRRYKAMCEANLDSLGELLADSLVYTHSNASADTKASSIAGVKNKKWEYHKVDRPIEDIQVHGDCAIVTGQARIELTVGGNRKVNNARFVDVWVKGAKGWQMVAWQSTPIPA